MVFFSTHPSGGIRELWTNIARALQDEGARVQLAALYPVQTMADPAPDLRWHHVVPARPRGPLAQARMLAALARWLRRTRPRAIVTAMPAANVVVPLIARFASPCTRVITSHHSPTDTHSRVFDRADAMMGTLANVAAVVSVSDTVARSLDRKPQGYRDKRRTIHNGLPPDIESTLDALSPAGPRAMPRARRLVATGRLAYQKNYPMLLRALALMPDATLDIVGDGPDEAALRALAQELGIADRTVFHGYRPRTEALRLLARGDVFVQVSRFEGHSLGLLEAARLKLPLVVSDIPVQVEAVTAADGSLSALTVPLDDAPALAAACTALLADPATYRDYSARAQTIAREFTFDAMLTKYRDLV